MALALLLPACFGGADGASVLAEVNGVEIRCQGRIGALDAEACGAWGGQLLALHPDASQVLITVQVGANVRCSADFLSDAGHAVASASIPCEPPGS